MFVESLIDTVADSFMAVPVLKQFDGYEIRKIRQEHYSATVKNFRPYQVRYSGEVLYTKPEENNTHDSMRRAKFLLMKA